MKDRKVDGMHRNKSYISSSLVTACCVFLILGPPSCRAQLTFSSAIRLALQNSPRVKAAQNDLAKAQAALDVVKDIFIPSIVAGGGVGDSYGITLTVPTIFTIGAQSLVYSDQQRFYIHSAHSDLLAAGLALTDVRDEVEEDTVVTYLSLDEANASASTLAQQLSFAIRLVSIVQDRVNAGLDSPEELRKARRSEITIKLAQLQMKETVASLNARISDLTGMPVREIEIASESIPSLPDPQSSENVPTVPWSQSPGLLAAEANADARLQRAEGDARYTWRPTVTFGAQYGRVSPININNVSEFYNIHGNFNSASIGITIQLPVLDKVRKAAANESLLAASRARLDLDTSRMQLAEDRRKLQFAIPALALRAELAELDYSTARDQLSNAMTRVHAVSAEAPASPKEEQVAHIEERQRYLDLLDAKLQFSKTEIRFLRQTGQLESWILSPASIDAPPVELNSHGSP